MQGGGRFREWAADDVESVVKQLDRELKAALPEVKRVFIEAEARHPASPADGSGGQILQ